MANQEATHAGFYATLNGKYSEDIWKLAESFAAVQYPQSMSRRMRRSTRWNLLPLVSKKKK